jgi:hypothetical protein
MFRLFKKKSKLDVLNEKYQKLQQGDLKYAEAQELLKEIEQIEKASS